MFSTRATTGIREMQIRLPGKLQEQKMHCVSDVCSAPELAKALRLLTSDLPSIRKQNIRLPNVRGTIR